MNFEVESWVFFSAAIFKDGKYFVSAYIKLKMSQNISGYYFTYLGYFYSEIKINLFSTDSIKKKHLLYTI